MDDRHLGYIRKIPKKTLKFILIIIIIIIITVTGRVGHGILSTLRYPPGNSVDPYNPKAVHGLSMTLQYR